MTSRPQTSQSRFGSSSGTAEKSFVVALSPTPADLHLFTDQRRMIHALKRTATPTSASEGRRDAVATCILNGGNSPINPYRDSNPAFVAQQQRMADEQRRAPEEAAKTKKERELKAVRKACGDERPTQFLDAEDAARRAAAMPKLAPALKRQVRSAVVAPAGSSSLVTGNNGNDVSRIVSNISLNREPLGASVGGASSSMSLNNSTSPPTLHTKPFGLYSSGSERPDVLASTTDFGQVSDALKRAISPAGYVTRPLLRVTTAAAATRIARQDESQEGNGRSPQSPSRSGAADHSSHRHGTELPTSSSSYEVLAGGDYHSPFSLGLAPGEKTADERKEAEVYKDDITIFELKRAARKRHDAEQLRRAHVMQQELETGMKRAMVIGIGGGGVKDNSQLPPSSATRGTRPSTGRGVVESSQRHSNTTHFAGGHGAEPFSSSSTHGHGSVLLVAHPSHGVPSTVYFGKGNNVEYPERPPINPIVLQNIVEQKRAQEAYFGEKVSFGGVDDALLEEEVDRRYNTNTNTYTNSTSRGGSGTAVRTQSSSPQNKINGMASSTNQNRSINGNPHEANDEADGFGIADYDREYFELYGRLDEEKDAHTFPTGGTQQPRRQQSDPSGAFEENTIQQRDEIKDDMKVPTEGHFEGTNGSGDRALASVRAIRDGLSEEVTPLRPNTGNRQARSGQKNNQSNPHMRPNSGGGESHASVKAPLPRKMTGRPLPTPQEPPLHNDSHKGGSANNNNKVVKSAGRGSGSGVGSALSQTAAKTALGHGGQDIPTDDTAFDNVAGGSVGEMSQSSFSAGADNGGKTMGGIEGEGSAEEDSGGDLFDSSDDDENTRGHFERLYAVQHEEQQNTRRGMLRLLTPQHQHGQGEGLQESQRLAKKKKRDAAVNLTSGPEASGIEGERSNSLRSAEGTSHSLFGSKRRDSGEFDDDDLVRFAIESGAVTPTPSNQFSAMMATPTDRPSVPIHSFRQHTSEHKRVSSAPPAPETKNLPSLSFDTSVAGTLPKNPFTPPKIIVMLFSFANVMSLPCVVAMRKLGYNILYEKFHTVIDKSSCLTKTAYTAVVKSLIPDAPIVDTDRLFGCFERTGRGDIDVNVFLMGLQMLLGYATPGDALRYCIKSMDPRHGTPRYITRYEVQSILRCVQIQHNLLVSTNAARGLEELEADVRGTNSGGTNGGSGGGSRSEVGRPLTSPNRPLSTSTAGMRFLPSATPSSASALLVPSSVWPSSFNNTNMLPTRDSEEMNDDDNNNNKNRVPDGELSASTRRAVFAANIAAVAKGYGDSINNNYFGAHTVLPPSELEDGYEYGDSRREDGGRLSRSSVSGGYGAGRLGGVGLRSGSASSSSQHTLWQQTTHGTSDAARRPQTSGSLGSGRRGLLPVASRDATSSNNTNRKVAHSASLTKPPLASTSAVSNSKSVGGSSPSRPHTSSPSHNSNTNGAAAPPLRPGSGLVLKRLNSAGTYPSGGSAAPKGGGSSNSTNLYNSTITIGGSVGSGVAIDREFTIMHNAIIDLFEDTTRYDYLGRMALREFVEYISTKLAAYSRGRGAGARTSSFRRASSVSGVASGGGGGGGTGVSVLDGGPLIAPAHRLNSKQLVLQHVHQSFVDTTKGAGGVR